MSPDCAIGWELSAPFRGSFDRPGPPPLRADEEASRYPSAKPDVSQWKQAPNAAPQFDNYGEASSCADPPPYTYAGKSLNACDFPLGGFG